MLSNTPQEPTEIIFVTPPAIKYSKITKNIFNCVGGISSKEEMEKLKKHNIGCTIGRKVQEGYFE